MSSCLMFVESSVWVFEPNGPQSCWATRAAGPEHSAVTLIKRGMTGQTGARVNEKLKYTALHPEAGARRWLTGEQKSQNCKIQQEFREWPLGARQLYFYSTIHMQGDSQRHRTHLKWDIKKTWRLSVSWDLLEESTCWKQSNQYNWSKPRIESLQTSHHLKIQTNWKIWNRTEGSTAKTPALNHRFSPTGRRCQTSYTELMTD